MKPIAEREDRVVEVVCLLEAGVVFGIGAVPGGASELVVGGENGVGPVEGEPECGAGVAGVVVDVGLVHVQLVDDGQLVGRAEGVYCETGRREEEYLDGKEKAEESAESHVGTCCRIGQWDRIEESHGPCGMNHPYILESIVLNLSFVPSLLP